MSPDLQSYVPNGTKERDIMSDSYYAAVDAGREVRKGLEEIAQSMKEIAEALKLLASAIKYK